MMLQQFNVTPRIYLCKSCEEFAEAFPLNEDDLVLTNEYIFSPHFSSVPAACQVICQEAYGKGEPSDTMFENIRSGIRRDYRRVVAIGGGTILDLAKLLALCDGSDLAALFAGAAQPVKARELIAVPTTCGTGSEVTNVSVLSLAAQCTKKGLAHQALYADAVVLIPELLEGLPYAVFATSSIDAFIHAVESILSPKATAFSRMFGYQALAIILNGYRTVAAGGADARFPLLSDFLLASTMAGISFGNAGCGAVHALSYPLGAKYHVAHGESNYAVLFGVMDRYMHAGDAGELKTLNVRMASILGCGEKDVYAELQKLFSRILPPKRLREYGMTETDAREFADSVMQNQARLMNTSFVPLSAGDIFAIYSGLL